MLSVHFVVGWWRANSLTHSMHSCAQEGNDEVAKMKQALRRYRNDAYVAANELRRYRTTVEVLKRELYQAEQEVMLRSFVHNAEAANYAAAYAAAQVRKNLIKAGHAAPTSPNETQGQMSNPSEHTQLIEFASQTAREVGDGPRERTCSDQPVRALPSWAPKKLSCRSCVSKVAGASESGLVGEISRWKKDGTQVARSVVSSERCVAFHSLSQELRDHGVCVRDVSLPQFDFVFK